jgi:DNA-binding response OmpR family regulator
MNLAIHPGKLGESCLNGGFRWPSSAQRSPRLCGSVFELDSGAGELRKHGVGIRLREQPFAVLQILLEKPGQHLTGKEPRQRLWPGNTCFAVKKNTGEYGLRKICSTCDF